MFPRLFGLSASLMLCVVGGCRTTQNSPDVKPLKPPRTYHTPASSPKSDQAVLVHYKLSDDTFGSQADRNTATSLEAKLEQAVKQAGVGTYDGDEYGGGECVIYLYGPDADRLYAAVESVLKAKPLPNGSYAIKRKGSMETRLELSPW